MSNIVPNGAILLAQSNAGTTSATVTFAAVANRVNYVTGIVITSSGATAAGTVTATLTNSTGGTLSFVYPQVAIGTNNQNPLELTFNTPVVASGSNTAMVCSITTGSGTTATAITMTGYML